MGALPRLWGSSEACAPIMPRRAVRSVAGRRIWLHPSTNTRSSDRLCSSATVSSSFTSATWYSGRLKRRHTEM